MEDNSHVSIITIVINLAKAYLNRLSELAHLVNLETKLALKTFINLIFLFILLLFFLCSIWLCLQAMLIVKLVSLQFSWQSAISITLIINLFLFASVCFYMLWIKKYLFFPATRRQISDKSAYIEGNGNEQSTSRN